MFQYHCLNPIANVGLVVYRLSSRTASALRRDPVSKKPKNKTKCSQYNLECKPKRDISMTEYMGCKISTGLAPL